MTRASRPEQPSHGISPAELGDLLRVPPPAFLDALVKQRVGEVLEHRRAERAGQGADAKRPSATQPLPSTPGISSAEAWTYALGFLAYGAQLADGVARMLWRAMTG
jgi:hypothetical protein